ncbi:hypothetical protein AB6B39_12520 [Algimonas porphyrae]|uniref:hypothetical protein n=1 Tax=Algimonas porphyrae TaxID=1128113 RepID=UPI00352AB88E
MDRDVGVSAFRYDFHVGHGFCRGGVFETDTEIVQLFKDESRRLSYSYPYFGNVVSPPLSKRSEPVCLNITLASMSEESVPTEPIRIAVVNTRPCWLIECWLD